MSVADLRARAEELRRQADLLESSICTGLTASWCPMHGDCTCYADNRAEWQLGDLDDPLCPLHGPDSSHAEAASS